MADTQDNQHAGFVPEEKPSAGFELNTVRPKTRKLNSTKVMLAGGAVGLVLLFALMSALKPPQTNDAAKDDKKQQETATSPNAVTAGAINALPKDYGAAIAEQRDAEEQRARAAARAQQQANMPGSPAPGQVSLLNGSRGVTQQIPTVEPYRGQANGGNSALDTELARIRGEALKRADAAQTSGVTFGKGGGGASSSPAGMMQPMQMPQIPQVTGQIPSVGGMPDNKAARDDANRQDDKAAFASGGNSKEDNPYNQHALIVPRTHDIIQAGTMIPALFLTGVNSDLPGMLTAQVSQNVYDTPSGTDILIPQGTRLIGQYDSRVTFGQERVLLVWSRIVFPNGSSVMLEGMPGVDMSGYAGVSDKVDNHYGKLLAGVLFSSVLSTAAVTSQGSTSSAVNPSYGTLAAQGAGQAINQAGQKFVQRALDIQPTLIVRPGQRVGILISKDIQLPPYGG
ncbi:TrbI/VirB10 family protein (plasmid) [Dyella sp. BiH032]|uniref:TrbI/VirB10 family protein n=1 Tax=Dyella sp. BiH032 TaxID=3075430 RepID=UPI002893274B|nr:TrbI/VirB10 family protein [Dyella sp. BiH032]WNL48561.1 TrbI/VirB10 family protein [Dyella sp. BiH032]